MNMDMNYVSNALPKKLTEVDNSEIVREVSFEEVTWSK